MASFPRVIGRYIAAEASVLLTVFGYRQVRIAESEGITFGYARRSGVRPLYLALGMVALVEAVGLHLLLIWWLPPTWYPAVWVLTAIGLYALLWILADYLGMQVRPHRIADGDLYLRWLKANAANLKFDFGARSYYLFPQLRTDYFGSLSYSFNIGKVHFVQLQNFPSYVREWNSWNFPLARRDFYFIRESFYWLKNDLAIARNRGDIIIVSVHDYGDKFVEPGRSEFDAIVRQYGVSAVFAGHIHQHCGPIGTISQSNIRKRQILHTLESQMPPEKIFLTMTFKRAPDLPDQRLPNQRRVCGKIV